MRYEIQGPFRVVDEHGSAVISARKLEVLFAVLLIRCDQVVTIDQLMLEIWGEKLPRRATAGLHVYISQLRKLLRRPGDSTSRIITQPPGYLLRLGDDELDYLRFRELSDQGRAHAGEGRHREAIACFEAALDQWRGTALEDLCNGPIIDGFLAWITEARLECLEMLIESRLQLGKHRELIGQLHLLAAQHPLREGFHRQLMLALYRSDRRAEALRVYRTARQTLNEELGLEPCRALQDLQQAILTADDRPEVTSDLFGPYLPLLAQEPLRSASRP
ncbi:AfsR/SARP family transcriptional regulator [Streptomyces hoynatensis]|uniref:Activator protein n=1 Tax=Streptomyces hoynatensis TaxID=1141874 RepID=A0A3A9YWA5_9ACTN|nr:AfsR/SARP family transcriptional regulator [Streptomyces hoynatensis]RKN40069.1 activator protein [Streptomyces hoynatensis]